MRFLLYDSDAPQPSSLRSKVPLLILVPALALSCRPEPEKRTEPSPTPPAAVNPKPIELPSPVLGKPYPGTGVITLINLKEGWVEIKHEEIQGLMPAMTMEFWVKNRSLLKRVRVGDTVDFVVVETEKGEFVTKLERAAKGR